jgi:hypothetical protein
MQGSFRIPLISLMGPTLKSKLRLCLVLMASLRRIVSCGYDTCMFHGSLHFLFSLPDKISYGFGQITLASLLLSKIVSKSVCCA